MRKILFVGAAFVGLTSSLAMAQPEDLLPDIFNDPPPAAPAPMSSATATVRQPSQPRAGEVQATPDTPTTSEPVIQQLPGSSAPFDFSNIALPEDFPTLAELEEMDEDEINELLGLRPKFDVPPAARRAVSRIGVIGWDEGGFGSQSLASQPAALVRAALQGTRGPIVSRWGHILLRRALASRMDAPEGMDPVEFTALRAAVLNTIGEAHVARSLVQDVDGSNFDAALTGAAFDAYLATGDLLGICPIARLHPDHREDGEWVLTQAICSAFLGEERSAERRLQRALGTGEAEEIDVRLAQRYAGAAGDGGRAVNVEWDNVEEISPWRFALSRALGVELPESLLSSAPSRYAIADALIPATPIVSRVAAADQAGAAGVMSSAAMVDLYSQLYASTSVDAGERQPSTILREAYVAAQPADRLAAIQSLWGDSPDYGRLVLTAYSAARIPPSDGLADNADRLIASMLAAGLDQNALRWADIVEEGSVAWGLLALANPATAQVDADAVETFISEDGSPDSRKSRFLLAGLAGLGKIDAQSSAALAQELGVNFNRSSAWSERIDAAGRYRNAALVSLLAGLGMQGDGWHRMTARHLYHIVSALNAAGLNAEARMIAAEAVARG